MSFVIGLILGICIGGAAGVFAVSLVSVNSRAEEDLLAHTADDAKKEENPQT